MPDNSSQNFKVSQKKHADQIETERGLMDALGMTRGQVRERLASEQKTITEQAKRVENTVERPEPVTKTSESRTKGNAVFILSGEKAGKTNAGNSGGAPGVPIIIAAPVQQDDGSYLSAIIQVQGVEL